MKFTFDNRTTVYLSPLIPYLAVAIGMYWLGSGLLAIGLYHAGLISVMLICKRHDESRKTILGNFKWSYAATAAIFALGGVILYNAWPYLNTSGTSVSDRLLAYGINKHNWPYFCVYFCLCNSTLEEIFWRGFHRNDCARLDKNDLFFAGYHAFVLAAFAKPLWMLPVFMSCAFAGWLWRILRRMSGGLTLPIITHIIADASIVFAVYMRIYK